MNGYFSVFDPNGKKIADCGALRDALNLVGGRNKIGKDITISSNQFMIL